MPGARRLPARRRHAHAACSSRPHLAKSGAVCSQSEVRACHAVALGSRFLFSFRLPPSYPLSPADPPSNHVRERHRVVVCVEHMAYSGHAYRLWCYSGQNAEGSHWEAGEGTSDATNVSYHTRKRHRKETYDNVRLRRSSATNPRRPKPLASKRNAKAKATTYPQL